VLGQRSQGAVCQPPCREHARHLRPGGPGAIAVHLPDRAKRPGVQPALSRHAGRMGGRAVPAAAAAARPMGARGEAGAVAFRASATNPCRRYSFLSTALALPLQVAGKPALLLPRWARIIDRTMRGVPDAPAPTRIDDREGQAWEF